MKLSNEYKYQNYDKEYITKHSTGIKSTLNIINHKIIITLNNNLMKY